VSEAKSISNDAIPRIASGLCSGMAHTGGMCGALSGAILAIGLAIGRDSADCSIEPAYSQVRSLIASFQERHGSTSCPELIECDLSTEQGQLVFEQEHRIERCRHYVEDAARIAQGLAQLGH
jgi:C_GCAxxG_C_C family probable redox protein